MPTISRQEQRQPEASTLRAPLPSPLQALHWAVGLLMGWEARARQRHQLLSMDERMLRDIGIDRETARGEYVKPFWRL